MIRLTRLNQMPLVLNSDLIEHIDVTPDTVITLTTGQILRVRECADEVVRRVVEFRRRVNRPGGMEGESGCQEVGQASWPVFLGGVPKATGQESCPTSEPFIEPAESSGRQVDPV